MRLLWTASTERSELSTQRVFLLWVGKVCPVELQNKTQQVNRSLTQDCKTPLYFTSPYPIPLSVLSPTLSVPPVSSFFPLPLLPLLALSPHLSSLSPYHKELVSVSLNDEATMEALNLILLDPLSSVAHIDIRSYLTIEKLFRYVNFRNKAMEGTNHER